MVENSWRSSSRRNSAKNKLLQLYISLICSYCLPQRDHSYQLNIFLFLLLQVVQTTSATLAVPAAHCPQYNAALIV